MNQAMKMGTVSLMLASTLVVASPAAMAGGGTTHKITGKSVLAGLTSLIIWPGIGQAINGNPGDKVATHAVIGLLPPFRFWSGWDGLVNRTGGYWHGRI
jgi:hypothetical protein